MHRISQYLNDLKIILDQISVEKINLVITILHEARLNGRQIFLMGNGGCAATASHFAYDLTRNTHLHGWPGFKVKSLVDNIVALTAYANEDGFDNIYVAQLENNLYRSDVVLVMAASGNSQNLIRAVEFANKRGATTVAFTGFDGGRIGSIVDVHVNFPGANNERVEELHFIVEHVITSILREDATQANTNRQLDFLFPNASSIGKGAKENVSSLVTTIQEDTQPIMRSSSDIFIAISSVMASQTNLQDLLRRVLMLTLNNLQASSGSIVIINDRKQVVESALAYNGNIQSQQQTQKFTEIIDNGLAGWVVQNKRAALVNNTKDDPRWLRRDWDNEQQIRSAVSVPMMDNERVVGVLTLVKHQAGKFTDSDVSLLAAIAVFISVINYSV